jgi:hypothetical protein
MADADPIIFDYTFLIDEGLKSFKLDWKTIALVQEEPKDIPP